MLGITGRVSSRIPALDVSAFLDVNYGLKVSDDRGNDSYTPRPLPSCPPALDGAWQDVASVVHDAWARRRLDDGWRWGPERSDARKTHPCLVPYEELPESEQAYDLATARTVVGALHARGYLISPPPGIPGPRSSSVAIETEERLRSLSGELEDLGYSESGFDIRAETGSLISALKQDLREAAVLYGGRIGERLTHEVLDRLGRRGSATKRRRLVGNFAVQLSNLNTLGLLPSEVRRRLQELRRLANGARHAHPLHLELAEDVPLLVDAGFSWLLGLHARNAPASAPAAPTSSAALRGLLEAEAIVERSDGDAAIAALDACVARMPSLDGHPRILQLRAVARSRQGTDASIAEALASLERIPEPLQGEDEVLGIAGGALKRRAFLASDEKTRRADLELALGKYHLGWSYTQQRSIYAGINVAALSLWTGRREEAERAALSVDKLARVVEPEVVEAEYPGTEAGFDLWRRLSLAEARLILAILKGTGEDLRAAGELFRNAFAYAEAHGMTEPLRSAQLQLRRHLDLIHPFFTDVVSLLELSGGRRSS